MHGLLPDIGIALIAATALGLASHWLRQPVILGYLIAGALVGPIGFGWVHDRNSIETIGEIGLVLLLFIIGLEMDLRQLAASGRQLLIAGLGQFPLSFVLGLLAFPLFGWALAAGGLREGLYLALLTGLSSTAIVVKLLADKVELDTIAGRLTVGILVLQDVFAILVLAFQPNLSDPSLGPVLKALGGTIVLVVGGWLASRWVLGPVFHSISRTPELVVAVSIGWCAFTAAAASMLELSSSMGALVAGLALANTPFRIHVAAKTLPLRDFFLTLFFVALGMQIVRPTWALAGPVAAVVGFVVVSRFLTVYPLVAFTGGGRRTAFITSLNLAQVSEFSLVIAALGLTFRHISPDFMGVIIYAMAVTAVLSSYLIRFSHPLSTVWDRLLGHLGLGRSRDTDAAEGAADHRPIAVLGVHRTARAVLERLERDGRLGEVLVVDFNTEVLNEWRAKGCTGVFGDLASLDTLHHAHLEHARVIVLSVPDMLLKGVDTLALVRSCRALSPHAVILAPADSAAQAESLRAAGADAVVLPHELLADRLVSALAGQAG